MEKSSLELDLYTIPSYSSWFSWNNIHEVERFSLREFFDGSSITRSPRIYKEYRDFIISKFREDPTRKLTFTEVRKSLVGDVSVLQKVFTFLEKWGLINFNVNTENKKENNGGKAGSFGGEEEDEEEGEGKWRLRVEEGPPHGVRVVGAPNSLKPVVAPPSPPKFVADGTGFEERESGFKLPPLASYSDVYGELIKHHDEKEKGLVCGSCKESRDTPYYEYTKEGDFVLCENCFKSGNYDKSKSADDFKLKDSGKKGPVWTEAETLLLLDSVLKHGDDWDLVAQNVRTKTRMDCISKLMQLPFGDLMLGSARKKGRFWAITGEISKFKQGLSATDVSQTAKIPEDKSNEVEQGRSATDASQMAKIPEDANNEVKQDPSATDVSQTAKIPEGESDEAEDVSQQDRETTNEGPPQKQVCMDEGPPPKRVCRAPISDASSSLMKQVARISTMVGPHVTASAAEAAVTALCYDNQCSRELFDEEDVNNEQKPPAESSDQGVAQGDNPQEQESPNQSDIDEAPSLRNIIPVNLRMRAATATALGAAAAHAKLLADQEERDVEHLVAGVIEAQMKKVLRKLKYVKDLEVIMEHENSQLDEVEESLVAERMDVLQRVFDAGIPRWKEHSSLKSQIGSA